MRTIHDLFNDLRFLDLMFRWEETEVPQIRKAVITKLAWNRQVVIGYAVSQRDGNMCAYVAVDNPVNSVYPKPVIDLREACVYLTDRWLASDEATLWLSTVRSDPNL